MTNRISTIVRRFTGSVALAAYASLAQVPTQAVAQTVPTATATSNLDGMSVEEAERQRRQLFQRMLERPDDLDTAFSYAALSVRVGDLEGAIATLERMLIFAPGLPRLQLELGLLYYRLNAFVSARTYLQAAVAGGAPPAVQQRVETLLARIDRAEDRNTFSAQLRTGIRYQTNANRAPGSANIVLNGLPFVLNRNGTADADANVFVAGNMHVSRDLGSQGDTLDLDLVGYAARQFDRHELDLATAEATFGPAFDLGRFDIDNAKLGVFAIASGLFLDDDFYGHAFGAGTRYVAQVRPDTGLALKAEYRRRVYHDTARAPLASLRTGNEYRIGGVVNHILDPDQLISAGLSGQWTTAQRSYLEHTEFSGFVNYARSFASPVPALEKPWTLSLGAGFTLRRYDAPDPFVNANASQDDDELFARAALTIPFNVDSWAIAADVEYRDVRSNYTTRDHDNFSASLALVKTW